MDITTQLKSGWELLGNGQIILVFYGIMLIIQLINSVSDYALCGVGITPRTGVGAIGIFTAPFLHAGFGHLLSNTAAFMLLSYALITISLSLYLKVFIITSIGGGLFTWCFGRDNLHVGASGVIFGMLGYIIVSAIATGDARMGGMAFLAVVLYGGSLKTMLPTGDEVSWEMHLGGFIAGAICALVKI
jgi:membrane associated rhomboid family serine protease